MTTEQGNTELGEARWGLLGRRIHALEHAADALDPR